VNTPDIKKIVSAIESKKTGEKAILLGVLLLAIGYSWLLLVSDRIDESQAEINRRISVLSAQFVEETNRYSNIERNYRSDPNAFARNKRQELQQETIEVDERLRRLYGQLVQPRQMAFTYWARSADVSMALYSSEQCRRKKFSSRVDR